MTVDWPVSYRISQQRLLVSRSFPCSTREMVASHTGIFLVSWRCAFSRWDCFDCCKAQQSIRLSRSRPATVQVWAGKAPICEVVAHPASGLADVTVRFARTPPPSPDCLRRITHKPTQHPCGRTWPFSSINGLLATRWWVKLGAVESMRL